MVFGASDTSTAVCRASARWRPCLARMGGLDRGITTQFSSRAGWRGVNLHKAVMPALSAAAPGSSGREVGEAVVEVPQQPTHLVLDDGVLDAEQLAVSGGEGFHPILDKIIADLPKVLGIH